MPTSASRAKSSLASHPPSRVTEMRDGASMAQQYYSQNIGVSEAASQTVWQRIRLWPGGLSEPGLERHRLLGDIGKGCRHPVSSSTAAKTSMSPSTWEQVRFMVSNPRIELGLPRRHQGGGGVTAVRSIITLQTSLRYLCGCSHQIEAKMRL